MAAQHQPSLPLTQDAHDDYALENFITSPSNQDAYNWITSWPQSWPSHCLILVGEAGAGKTHLAHIWAKNANASWLDTDALKAREWGEHHVIEWQAGVDEEALFHLFNEAKSSGKSLLITMPTPPSDAGITLPDLLSRLHASPIAVIMPPDDTLLQMLLAKQLADRQLTISQDVIDYILPRIERRYDAITQLVQAIDEASLAQKRPITIPFVREILTAY